MVVENRIFELPKHHSIRWYISLSSSLYCWSVKYYIDGNGLTGWLFSLGFVFDSQLSVVCFSKISRMSNKFQFSIFARCLLWSKTCRQFVFLTSTSMGRWNQCWEEVYNLCSRDEGERVLKLGGKIGTSKGAAKTKSTKKGVLRGGHCYTSRGFPLKIIITHFIIIILDNIHQKN